jgi:hypothetical protein
MSQFRADLAHVDATIRLFALAMDPETRQLVTHEQAEPGRGPPSRLVVE